MYLDNPFAPDTRSTDYLQLPLTYDSGTRKILFIGSEIGRSRSGCGATSRRRPGQVV